MDGEINRRVCTVYDVRPTRGEKERERVNRGERARRRSRFSRSDRITRKSYLSKQITLGLSEPITARRTLQVEPQEPLLTKH